jgi:putative ABC transport system permease protein
VLMGLAGGVATSRLLTNLLFEVSPRNPLAFAVVALVLALTSAAAAYLPARRALRIDPMAALRAEWAPGLGRCALH